MSGKKLWKNKGVGKARMGSMSVPPDEHASTGAVGDVMRESKRTVLRNHTGDVPPPHLHI